MFWKNLPNETTPINANNLARSERYLLATAGSNGDFILNIDGASGLAVNDIIRVAFPTATNSSSNARLSIDGGINYINIANKVGNISANKVHKRKLKLMYDGINFNILDGKSSITVGLSANFTITSTSASVFDTLPLASIENISGGDLTLVSNRIVVGEGISKVLISGSVYIDSGVSVSTLLRTAVFRNSTLVFGQLIFVPANFVTCPLPAKIIDVVEGDVIDLRGSVGSGTMRVSNQLSRTYLTILAVE